MGKRLIIRSYNFSNSQMLSANQHSKICKLSNCRGLKFPTRTANRQNSYLLMTSFMEISRNGHSGQKSPEIKLNVLVYQLNIIAKQYTFKLFLSLSTQMLLVMCQKINLNSQNSKRVF